MHTLQAVNGNGIGKVDIAFGTVWYAVLPGIPNLYIYLKSLQVNNAGTNNGIYLMRPLGAAVIQNDYTTAVDTIILGNDPSPSGNTINTGDQCVIAFNDGTYRRVQVSVWTAASLTVQFTANLPANITAGATLWNFGIFTDTEPLTGLPFPLFDTPINTVTTIPQSGEFPIGFRPFTTNNSTGVTNVGLGAPMMLYCPNAVAKTILNHATFAYGPG